MKKILIILIPLAILALIVIKLVANKQVAEDKVYIYNADQAIPVTVTLAKNQEVNQSIQYTGTFEPFRESKLSAEVQGKVNQLFVENGSHVRAGQVLIQLDDALLKLQLEAAKVQVASLEADLKRYQVLVENDAIQGVQLEKTEVALASARIQVQTVQEQINKSQIKAPFAGIITAKLTERGDFALPSKPLLQLTDIHQLKLQLQIPESDLKFFAEGSPTQVTVPALDLTLSAKVSLVGSRGSLSKSFPVELMLNNLENQPIKAGMFGEVSLVNSLSASGIVIPSSAILGSDLQPQVYLVKNGKAILQDVKIARRMENQVLISAGLQPGDQIISSGLINVYEGANISINQ
ncbi:RND family efflux transporter, MFP subunit [Algoriphagus faecimaris]|uniref:RND family efflux transporter, MFP subunit n=1 Tax=Algoriphagus faecimaris TaxID=686796 RepID=A0A1G6VLE9_9BACT|nr:efflux RND transporter periplasmic adaptor subunit [Algoriphagus faecimaris]SDD54432.1 RND family efflux transporter, MFP subunit [Algoriphagus faecimaris]